MNLDRLLHPALALIAAAIFAAGYSVGASKGTLASDDAVLQARATETICREAVDKAERTMFVSRMIQATGWELYQRQFVDGVRTEESVDTEVDQ